MDQSSCDVLIIGSGLGAVAIARHLRSAGASVSILTGVGCARFKHLDGGIVSPTILERVIGSTDGAPLHQIGGNTVFRRDLLEQWAVETLDDGVRIVTDFEEARAIPRDTGRVAVMNDDGDRLIEAHSIVLTEGANPKIGIAARVRDDFDPEDMIHFGRAIVAGAQIPEPVTGSWRTSWGAPAWYAVIPHPDGAIVSASVRIENVMRVGRDGREVLKDLLASPLAGELGIQGDPGEIGMELVPLRASTRPARIASHNISISFDANGNIDARDLNRYNSILSSGAEMGAMMAREWPQVVEWDETGIGLWEMFGSQRTPYHDDKQTGYIEDGPAPIRGIVQRLFNR